MAHGWCILLLTLGVCGLSSSVPRQFHVVKEEKTWAEAQQYCREEFTDLATIDNMTEWEAITGVVQNGKVWIGLKESEYRNWDTQADEPDQTDDTTRTDCVSFKKENGKWHDGYCTGKYGSICYNGRNSTHPYVLVEDGKNWTNAQRYCREKYTDLATIRNQAENDEIKDLIESKATAGSGGFLWFGFRDGWEWSDGSSSFFRHWARNEPNTKPNQQPCVAMKSSGQWADHNCDKDEDFVCYEALPTVEVVSPQSPLYSGDVVTLRCDTPRYTAQQQYVWLKDNSPVPGETSQTINITLPGQYQCHRRRGSSSVAPYISTPVNITFNGLPTAVVVSPPAPFYFGHVVSLRCDISEYSDWHRYSWRKDNSPVPGKTSQTINITLPLEAGQYQCSGERPERPETSSVSSSVDIIINDLLTDTVEVVPNNDKLVLVNEEKTWKEALEYCRQHHEDLVSVTSEKIQSWVEGWVKGASTPHVWVGLRYSCNLGFWFWVSGEIICDYDNWVSSQERDQGCSYKVGAMRKEGGKWVSFEEIQKLNFICTKEGQWN